MLEINGYEAMAMLDLDEAERKQLAMHIEGLKESFSALDSVDTSGILPLVSVPQLQNVLREDVADKMMSRDEILKNAPEQYDGYFQVPGTLD
ncbi:MAG: Asp-tRNA(Asn)/Glu-tRNA(Gln) amidotransferase subunit GatC [Oscillospiraceae bacterium]|nr:Asp-tRNA(Asn)/Glu-tRNA(Gln) amidotransferase subunit GatC [Oscillospiraceae bacterium]